jgi:PEP-CTERM motif
MQMKQIARAVVAAAALASAGSAFAANATVSLDAPTMAANGVTAVAIGNDTYNSASGILTAPIDATKTTASFVDFGNADGFTLSFDVFGLPQTATFSNFSFDIASKTLFGNLTGTGVLASKLAYNTGGALLSAGSVITANGVTTASNFSLAPALSAYLTSKNIQPSQVAAATGVVKSIAMPSAVPEPSTYAMVLLGLGGIALAARRKKA